MNIEKDNSPLTEKERIARIRAMHLAVLAEKGQVHSVDLDHVDDTEKENVPTNEKLESILKATNGNSRGDFFDNVDGDLN